LEQSHDQKGDPMKTKNEIYTDAFDAIMQFYQKRVDLLNKIEESRLKLHYEYTEKRAKLLTDNKEVFEWLTESLSDLRKERINFQKKAIAKINSALTDAKVPDDLIKEWLLLITKLYHEDISTAKKMVSVDFEEIDNKLFDDLKETISKKLCDESDELFKTVKNIMQNKISADLENSDK